MVVFHLYTIFHIFQIFCSDYVLLYNEEKSYKEYPQKKQANLYLFFELQKPDYLFSLSYTYPVENVKCA